MATEQAPELDNFFATIQNPYPTYTYLRENEPVHWNSMFGCFMLSRYDDVKMVFSDAKRFSSDVWSSVPDYFETNNNDIDEEKKRALRQIIPFLAYNLQGMDPPEHTRQRTLMVKTFTPRMLESFRPSIQRTVDQLIDQRVAEGKMDLVADVGYPLPSNVILDLLGIPRSGRPYIRDSAEAINEFVTTLLFLNGANWAKLAKIFNDLSQYIKELIVERRAHPTDDLLSKLAQAEENGDMFSEDEIVVATNFLLFAGHETTANLISTGMYYLLQNPGILAKLRAKPELISSAVEELVRYVSPVHTLARVTTEAITLHGVEIPERSSVYLLVGAANRDADKFPDPEQLDINRPAGRAIGFGYGIHYCLGAALARMEGQITIDTLLKRLSNIQLSGETPEFRPNYALRGLVALPVTFEPTKTVYEA